MVPSNDIRVRSLMQRFKIKGYALWAYLADALRDAPPEGIPIRGAALSVIADFFPMPLETAAAIVTRCVEVGLFRIDGGRLLAPEQPAPGAPPSAGARPGPAWLYEPLTRDGAPEPPIVRQARENLQRRYAREQAAAAPPNA